MKLQELVDFWTNHGTKILGSITGSISTFVVTALITDGLIPEAQLKYWLFANAFFSGATVRRGFINDKATAPVFGQRGFARPLMLALLLAVAAPVFGVLHGCALSNPFAVAETPEQQAMALYGSYQIAKVQAAAIYSDPGTPDRVADALKAANDAASEPFEELYQAVLTLKAVEEEVELGRTSQEQLLMVTNKLLERYIKARQPLADLQRVYDQAKKEQVR